MYICESSGFFTGINWIDNFEDFQKEPYAAASLGQVHKVLQTLVKERVSIRDLSTILERLADYSHVSRDTNLLAEYVRQSLARQICSDFVSEDDNITVFTIDPQLEETFVHKGGPVSDTSVLLLHTNEWQSTNTLQASGELAMTSDMLMIEKLSTGNTPKGWRMFAGMSIWTEDQLAQEIKQGAWLSAKPTSHSVFDYNEDEQYLKALELCSKQTFSKYI